MSRIQLPEALPGWLPSKCSVVGTYEAVLARLYDVFHADFKQRHVEYQGRRVFWDNGFEEGSIYERGFLHLVTRDSDLAEKRCIDDYRAERLPWCRPTMEMPQQPEVLVWRYLDGSNVNVYLWLEEYDYVVVLKEKRSSFFLKTGYHIDGPSKRRSLYTRFEKRIVE